jgi:hypothetical protein
MESHLTPPPLAAGGSGNSSVGTLAEENVIPPPLAREGVPRNALSRVLAALRDLTADIDPVAALICILAAAAYTLSHFEGSSGFFSVMMARHLRLGSFADLAPDMYWLLASNVLFGLLPLLSLIAMREPLSEYGVGLGDRRFGLIVSGLFLTVMLPIVFVISHRPDFRGTYPLNQGAARDLRHFAIWEVLYVGYFVGWEFFHRGFLLFGLRRRIGNLAIFVAAVPFTLEHFAKPEIEAWGSFVAAVALGFLAVRARSFWYGALIHGGVAFFMDVVRSWSRLVH